MLRLLKKLVNIILLILTTLYWVNAVVVPWMMMFRTGFVHFDASKLTPALSSISG